MVRGSGDMVASLDTLLCLRAKGNGSFTLEHGKARRSLQHDTILVQIEEEDARMRLVSEGPAVYADDKVEATLDRILRVLRAEAKPLERAVLLLRSNPSSEKTFERAAKLGVNRGQLSRRSSGIGKATLYELTEWSGS
jgi:hypothetical protein